MALSREERETVLILNDKGEITISTNSPTQAQALTKRLGKPHRKEVSWWEWEFTEATHTFTLPTKRRRNALQPLGDPIPSG